MDHSLLSQHHKSLETRIDALLTRADCGDCHELAKEWGRFEAELLQHLDLEERELLPGFARENPEEAATLRREHEQLRKDVLALGIRSDLHMLRVERVRGFVADLRAHAKREDVVLYPWAKEHVGQETWSVIAHELRHVANTVKRELSNLAVRLP
jgi:hemerythrin-like domain-containing protein